MGAVYANSKEIIRRDSKLKLLEKRETEACMWILLPPVEIWTRNTI